MTDSNASWANQPLKGMAAAGMAPGASHEAPDFDRQLLAFFLTCILQ